MWIKNKFKAPHHQTGVTIVELMISIVLGLLLLSAATAMTVKSMVMNGETLASAKLNQDLDSVLHVMVNDIRRAGYSGGVVPFFPGQDLNIVSASCVLYAYDANLNGALADQEKFGFKFLANTNKIQMRTECTADDATCAASCAAGTWVDLTDPSQTIITGLSFDTQNSKCISITDPANESGTNNNNYWVTTTDAKTEFPCLAPNGNNLTNYYLDANSVYQSGTFVLPASGDRLIEARQINVEVTGEKAGDDSMVKSQKVAINVRNNHVYTIP